MPTIAEYHTLKREYNCSFYSDFLEEASFLYEYRLNLFDDPEITWLDIEDIENRFESHIDGLVVGGDPALEICRQQVSEGDPGELHAAVRIFCRQNRKDLVFETLELLDPEDAEKLSAVADALKEELPDSWQAEFLQLLSTEDQKLISVVAEVAGYRRLPAGQMLLAILPECKPVSLPNVIRALGRLGEKDDAALLSGYLQHDDKAVCAAAAMTLLRMGDQQAVSYCLSAVESKHWPLIPLALGCGPSAVPVILQKASVEDIHPDCLIALGLAGDITAIEVLIYWLNNERTADTAAISLNLITGANLYEKAFIPEAFEEDELFEDEVEDFKEGKVPKHPDGEPFGSIITRTSQNPEDWLSWWGKNNSRFSPQILYRNGKPYSPVCLLENLQYEFMPHIFRLLAYEELVIRYGVDIPFATDMAVKRQKRVIAKYAGWIQANSKLFEDGEWYYKGKPAN
jgi:uncharacterized protein (TIGR02270 family)